MPRFRRLAVIRSLLSSAACRRVAPSQRLWPTGASILDDDRSIPREPSPPGLRASFRSTRDAGFRLAFAHIDLAKAEAKAIGGELAKVAAFAGIAFVAVVLAGILAVVGTSLFVAEWLLGSMGWGVLHGLLLLVAIAIASGLGAVGTGGSRIGGAFIVGVLVAVAIALLMAFALPNRLYATIGESVVPGVEAGVRPLVVGVAVWAVLGALGGLILAWRSGSGGSRLGGLVGGTLVGAIVGAIVGAVSSIDTGPQVGAGIGIAVGYVVWIGGMVSDVARTGVDTDALKDRFYPHRTIETSKETLEWLQSKMPPGTGS